MGMPDDQRSLIAALLSGRRHGEQRSLAAALNGGRRRGSISSPDAATGAPPPPRGSSSSATANQRPRQRHRPPLALAVPTVSRQAAGWRPRPVKGAPRSSAAAGTDRRCRRWRRGPAYITDCFLAPTFGSPICAASSTSSRPTTACGVIVTATGEVVPAVEAHLPETTFTIDTDPDGAL